MKRYLLFILLSLLILPAMSQSLALSNADGPLSDGDTVVLWGELSAYLTSYVEVTNNSGASINVICARGELDVVPGSINYFCWDQCYDPSVDTSGPLPIAGGASNATNFSGDYTPNNYPGTSFISYTFFDAANSGDKVTFVVAYAGSPVGIADMTSPKVSVSKIYPNPAETRFSFNYRVSTGSQPVKIIIRDILGDVVKEIAIGPGEGTLTISAEGMKGGIYFYTTMVGSEVITTRKLVIR